MQTARRFTDYRKPLQSLPNNIYCNGERVACFNRPHVSSDPYDEGILASRIVANACIATGWYSLLMWDYYRSMPPNSGVLFSTAVRSRELSPDLLYPGDIRNLRSSMPLLSPWGYCSACVRTVWIQRKWWDAAPLSRLRPLFGAKLSQKHREHGVYPRASASLSDMRILLLRK